MLDRYETFAEVCGVVKYEIVQTGPGFFGEPLFQACLFREEMHPRMVRRVLGSYPSRSEAVACLEQELARASGEATDLK